MAQYLNWLDCYDADIVYSYVPLQRELVVKIEKENSPAFLKEHEYGKEGKYLAVNLGHYCEPIGSISTIHSPLVSRNITQRENRSDTNIISQNDPILGDRFITDNFGNEVSCYNVLHEIKGLFGTICLTSAETPANHIVGTQRVHSPNEVIDKLANREATTVARLASIHTEAIADIHAYGFSDCFSIIVGTSLQDRICFWNLRKFHPERHDSHCSLILSEQQLQNDDILKSLGNYLNKTNFIGNNIHRVALRSKSLHLDKLNEIRDALKQYTYNSVSVAQNHDKIVVPTTEQLANSRAQYSDKFTFSTFENISINQISKPSHLKYISSTFESHGAGEFQVECAIDRHANLSRYSNVVDTWLLPRRAYISKAFGSSCSRISRNNLPTFLVGNKRNIFNGDLGNSSISVEIYLPDDIDVLNGLVAGQKYYPQPDKRHEVFQANIKYIAHSDKGKNFIGVVSMFESLNDAAEFMTNKLWRDVFQHVGNQGKEDEYILESKKLASFCNRDLSKRSYLMQQLRLDKASKASQYITACYKDALEQLIQNKIFSPVYTWSCVNCGHNNMRTVDALRYHNECEICTYNHSMKVEDEFSWKYLLNKFVHKTLFTNHGLPVLWGLSLIQNQSRRNSFLYLPEVNLRYDDKDPNQLNEIDLMGVYDGKLFAGEAKRSAESFCDNELGIEKYFNVIEQVMPDEAYLVFEQYSEKPENAEQTKEKLKEIRIKFKQKFETKINLKIIAFCDYPEFIGDNTDFGTTGRYVNKLFDGWGL